MPRPGPAAGHRSAAAVSARPDPAGGGSFLAERRTRLSR